MSAKTVDTTGITPLGMLTLTYLLNSSTSGYNGDETNTTACPSYGLLASPTSLGEHNGDVDSPNISNGGGDNINDNNESYNLREGTYVAANTMKGLNLLVYLQLIISAATVNN